MCIVHNLDVYFPWENDPKETLCEEERVCIASIETSYEINEDPNFVDTN